jgi:hypothetical protein
MFLSVAIFLHVSPATFVCYNEAVRWIDAQTTVKRRRLSTVPVTWRPGKSDNELQGFCVRIITSTQGESSQGFYFAFPGCTCEAAPASQGFPVNDLLQNDLLQEDV